MAKEKPPVFKDLEYYLTIDLEKNPFVVIGDLIEDHNWEFEIDRETLAFYKVPTENTFLQCKGCEACDKIKKLGELIPDWKVAKIVTKPHSEWTNREILWLISQRYSIREIAHIRGISPKLFIQYLNERFDSSESLDDLLDFDISYGIANIIRPMEEEVFHKLKTDYVTRFIKRIEFTEKVAIKHA